MKFKIGDRVERIKEDFCVGGKKIRHGDICEVASVDHTGRWIALIGYGCTSVTRIEHQFWYKHFKLVEEKVMTKEEIQKQIDNLQKELNNLEDKPNLEVGKWYITNDGNHKNLFLFESLENNYGYPEMHYTCAVSGTDGGRWDDNNHISNTTMYNNVREATNEEIDYSLKKEAKKRGFKKGVVVTTATGYPEFIKSDHNLSWEFGERLQYTGGGKNGNAVVIFDKGKWGEAIKEEPIMIKTTDGELEAKVVSSFEYNQVKIGCKYIDEETLKILLKWNSVNETGKDAIKKILKQMNNK